MINIQQYNWWCNEHKQTPDDWFIRFFKYCAEQYQENDYTINIFTVFSFNPNSNPICNEKTVNIFFIGENTSIFYSNAHLFDSMDTILTFFNDSHKSIRFPLWLIYWDFFTNGLFNIPNNEQKEIPHACIVVSHDQNGLRNTVCSKILPIMNIDSNFDGVVYSNLINVPKGIHAKREYIKKYRYNICIENSIRDGYVTEKIFESLYSGCVPIYGGPHDVESNILNRNDIVHILDNHINLDKTVSNTTWKDNALIYIFSAYLKIWSIIYHKIGLKLLKDDVIIVKYHCLSKDDCLSSLRTHWLAHKTFLSPRPHFIVGLDEYYVEDLAESMYQLYKL